MKSTLTTPPHGHDLGEQVSLSLLVSDTRWWRKLWCKITFQSPPMKRELYHATVTSATTFEIER